MMPNSQRILLSIVIASTQTWPQVRPCLDSLRDQARATGAEIILADGSGQALPNAANRIYPEVIWLKAPGASVFRLRALAMARAQGEIIAVTEDHCRVRPGWCERIIKAHQDYPTAAAIGGVVENGATEHLVDWASFLIVNGPFMVPIQNGKSERISLQANISYKRWVIPHPIPDLGIMEMLHNEMLREQGEKLVADDQIVIEHVQSLGFFGTCAAHFHNGRSIAGFRLQRMQPLERLVRLVGCFILPPVMLWRTLRVVLGKRRFLGRVLAGLPILVILLCCHAAGEFLGYIAGPGNSPEQLY